MVARTPRLRLPALALCASLFGLALVAAPAAPADALTAADVSAASAVTADALPTVQVNGVVWAQKIVGDTVYVGGSFTTAQPAGAAAGVGTVSRTNLLAYDLNTGALKTAFVPVTNGQVRAITASPDGSQIWVAGDFNQVNGLSRPFVAALDPTTGAPTSFRIVPNAPVYGIAISGSTVFFGGNFTAVNSTTRTRAASVSTSGTLLPFAPAVPDQTVRAVVVSPDGSKVVLGGSFTSLNGSTSSGQASARSARPPARPCRSRWRTASGTTARRPRS
ncbi:hypothetical protein GCM10025783_28240 [Amnibacterium soli]|uniref:Uncharacterized protein n=1 Tax=Amnibacterium soli TaxID=1282736 RepID=A0ABP8ZDQ5_9MICO